jgi:hypothetical protein
VGVGAAANAGGGGAMTVYQLGLFQEAGEFSGPFLPNGFGDYYRYHTVYLKAHQHFCWRWRCYEHEWRGGPAPAQWILPLGVDVKWFYANLHEFGGERMEFCLFDCPVRGRAHSGGLL